MWRENETVEEEREKKKNKKCEKLRCEYVRNMFERHDITAIVSLKTLFYPAVISPQASKWNHLGIVECFDKNLMHASS